MNFSGRHASTGYYVHNHVFFDNSYVTLDEADYCTQKQIDARNERIKNLR